MLAAIAIVLMAGVFWWVSHGFLSWVAGAVFIFYGAVIVNGLLDNGRSASAVKSKDGRLVSRHLGNRAQFLDAVELEGDGSYSFNIVGESHYQHELGSIAGPKGSEKKDYECQAIVAHEPDNEHDKNACAVIIEGQRVGYLSREDAKKQVSLRKEPGFALKVKAKIVGGWKSARSEGNYGVRLDYSLADIPADPLDREAYRFMGEKVPSGLTVKAARAYEASLREANDPRAAEWRSFRDAVEFLQSREGREEYSIKKPSLKQARDAYAAWLADTDRDPENDYFDDNELYERLIDLYPDIERL